MIFLSFFFLIGLSLQGWGKWNYDKNGADWSMFDPKCGKENQSPIDLKSSGPLKMNIEDDDFNKIYYDQKSNITINWNGHTSEV